MDTRKLPGGAFSCVSPANAPPAFAGVSSQWNFVRGQQAWKILAPDKSVFAFALGRQRVETDKGFVDEAGMTHDEAAFRQSIEELLHQRTEIGRLRKIIGAGEAGIERDACARRAAAKLRAQHVEKQRLGSAEPPGQRLIASALADPGVGRSLLHRREKRVAHPGKQLRML